MRKRTSSVLRHYPPTTYMMCILATTDGFWVEKLHRSLHGIHTLGEPPAAQVRVFSARDHTRALLAKDAWAAVGWSGDLVPLAERAGDLTLVAPRSGAPLWADLWAVPAGARNGSGVRRRLGFLLGIWILKRCPVVAAERAGDLTFVAPRSGAPLWADLWAVPAGARNGSGVRPHPWGFCSD